MASLVKIGNGVHAWIGSNGDSNAGAVECSNGLVAIDAQQTKALGLQFRQAIEKASGQPATLLVDTHFHLDHTAGNIAFSDVPIVAHDKTLQLMRAYLGVREGTRWTVSDSTARLQLFFGSNVQDLVPPDDPLAQWFETRTSGPEQRTIELVGPTETFDDHFAIECANDTLRAEYWGPAHCDGDLVFYLPQQKIAFLGDLLFVGRFPWLGDCDLDGWIAQLDRLLSLEIDTVVPGHGSVSTLKDVAAFRDLLRALREAAAHALRSGLSEEATVHEVTLPQYASMPRYREWLPPNLRAAYRYLKRG